MVRPPLWTAQSLVVDVNAWERHPELSVPMLLVVGDRDSDFAPNAAAFLARFPQHREAKDLVQRWYDGYRIVISEITATYGDGRLD